MSWSAASAPPGLHPSKTLLRPPEVRAEARRAAGVAEPSLSFAHLAAYRDEMIRPPRRVRPGRRLRKKGVDVHKGAARALGPGHLEVEVTAIAEIPHPVSKGWPE